MGKKAKITLICALAALPLLLIAAFLLFVLPYVNAASSMPEGASLAFFELAEGEYRVEWTEGVNATHYKLAIDGEEAAAGTLDTNSAAVSGLAEGEHVFTVTPFGSWSLFGAEKLREGEPVSYIELKMLYDMLKKMTFEERIKNFKLNPYRADVIIPALKIFLTISKLCGAPNLIVPQVGLVDGIIAKLFAERRCG